MKAKRVFIPLACLSVLASLVIWCWPRDAGYCFNRGQERFWRFSPVSKTTIVILRGWERSGRGKCRPSSRN